mgnify:CR=1 FL=1
MGCFNVTGAISNSVITGGDDIVLFLGVKCTSPHITNEFAPGYEFTPIALPIFGKYNDYGGIEDIQRDKNIELIEAMFGSDIDTILSLVDDRYVGRYIEKDKTELNDRLSEFEKNFKGYLNENYKFQLATAIEHRFVYDLMANDGPHYFGCDFERSYEKTIEFGIEEIKDEGEDSFSDTIKKIREMDEDFGRRNNGDKYLRKITYLAPWVSHNIWCHRGYFQNCSEYSFAEYFLYLYRINGNDNKLFDPSLKELFLGILKFMDFLSFNSIIFRVHNYHNQDTGYESMLAIHTALAEFYKNKVDERREEDED